MNNLRIRPDLQGKINEASNLMEASGTAICNYLIEMTVDHLITNLKEMQNNITEDYKASFKKATKGKFTLVEIKGRKIKSEIKSKGK